MAALACFRPPDARFGERLLRNVTGDVVIPDDGSGGIDISGVGCGYFAAVRNMERLGLETGPALADVGGVALQLGLARRIDEDLRVAFRNVEMPPLSPYSATFAGRRIARRIEAAPDRGARNLLVADGGRLDGRTVHFKDGSARDYDLVLCATGYRLHYPFIAPELLNWQGMAPQLYLNIFPPKHDNLAVMGMIEASGIGWQGRYEQADQHRDGRRRDRRDRRDNAHHAAGQGSEEDDESREDDRTSGELRFTRAEVALHHVLIGAVRAHREERAADHTRPERVGLRDVEGKVEEPELVGLLVQERLGLGVAHVQAVVVDEHGLLPQPLLPALIADLRVDALAQVVVERRVRQPGPGLSAARAGDVGHRRSFQVPFPRPRGAERRKCNLRRKSTSIAGRGAAPDVVRASVMHRPARRRTPHRTLRPRAVTEHAPKPQPIPARISDDGRTATWNPAMTFAPQVLVRVRLADGAVEERRSMNSGRARVREGEAILAILAESIL